MSMLINRTTSSELSIPTRPVPLVTAIVVTHNAEAHIRECLQGLMNQSMADRLEIIVIDEGSEQSEWAIIAEFQRRSSNIICIRTGAGTGNYAGWNMAAKIAGGAFITVLEVTDRLRRDAFEILHDTLEKNPDVMVAYGDTCFTAIPHETFENHTSYGKMIWPDYTFQQLTQLNLIAPHLMWRRELHDAVGYFNPRYSSQGMRDFLLRIVERFSIKHINEFTGLLLVTAGTQLTKGNPEKELADIRRDYQERQIPGNLPFAPPTMPEVQAAAPSTPPPSQEESYQATQALVNSGELDTAMKALTKHLQLYPGHAMAHNDFAVLCYQAGDKQSALFHYRMAAKFAPGNVVFQKNLADFYFIEEDNADEAIAIYLKLLDNYPKDCETLLNLGHISRCLAQPKEAESFYQKVLELEPWNSMARDSLTALQQEMAANDVCRATPTPAISAEDAYRNSKALLDAGNREEARAALEMLTIASPDFALAHNDMAVLSYQDGAMEKALFHYEAAVRLEPRNTVFRKNLADFYFIEDGRIDEAIDIYLDLMKEDPRDVETLLNLGRMSTALDRPDEAKAFYNKALQLEPWNSEARESLLAV